MASFALVVCADRRLSTGSGATVSDLDSKIELLCQGAVSFTTGLTAIIGAQERREVFNTPAIVASVVRGAKPQELDKAFPALGQALGRSFEEYLRSRPRNAWPASNTSLLTAGFAWFDAQGRPNIAALTLSSRSNTTINVSVDANLWRPAHLQKLVPLFFGRVEVPGAIANRPEPEWREMRARPLVAKMLALETQPQDLTVSEAEEYLRMTIRLSAEEGPKRLGLPATVSAESQCFVIRANVPVTPR